MATEETSWWEATDLQRYQWTREQALRGAAARLRVAGEWRAADLCDQWAKDEAAYLESAS